MKCKKKIEGGTIPDATIGQSSFKVVIETKLQGQFGITQLIGHLGSFKNEDYKVLMTLDPKEMSAKVKSTLDKKIFDYNLKFNSNIIHYHLTFEELINKINEVIDERDYDMQDVLEDYRDYCHSGGLISDDWKWMRVQLAGATIEINKKLGLYYDDVNRGFSDHKYLGLYDQKAVRAVGEITDIVTAIPIDGSLVIEVEKGKITDEMKEQIIIAIGDAKKYGYNLSDNKHQYFFVDEFFDTFFEKDTKYPPRGTRIFDLCEVLGVNKLPGIDEVANRLKTKKW